MTYIHVNVVNYNSRMNTTSLHTDDDEIFISQEWKNMADKCCTKEYS